MFLRIPHTWGRCLSIQGRGSPVGRRLSQEGAKRLLAKGSGAVASPLVSPFEVRIVLPIGKEHWLTTAIGHIRPRGLGARIFINVAARALCASQIATIGTIKPSSVPVGSCAAEVATIRSSEGGGLSMCCVAEQHHCGDKEEVFHDTVLLSGNVLLNTRIGWVHQDPARTVRDHNGLISLHGLLKQIIT